MRVTSLTLIALGHAQSVYDGDGLCIAFERCNTDGLLTNIDRVCCTETEACDLIANEGLTCTEFPDDGAGFSCCTSVTTADPGTTADSGSGGSTSATVSGSTTHADDHVHSGDGSGDMSGDGLDDDGNGAIFAAASALLVALFAL